MRLVKLTYTNEMISSDCHSEGRSEVDTDQAHGRYPYSKSAQVSAWLKVLWTNAKLLLSRLQLRVFLLLFFFGGGVQLVKMVEILQKPPRCFGGACTYIYKRCCCIPSLQLEALQYFPQK